MRGAATLIDHRRLMAGARNPADVATQAFGGVLARFRIRGLEAPDLARLLSRYFPDADEVWVNAPDADDQAGCSALCVEEFEDLLMLLREHRSEDSEETGWLAHAIAGLPGRQSSLAGHGAAES